MPYKNKKVILIIPAWNECRNLGEVLRKIPPDILDKVLVVDDGSTDGTAALAKKAEAQVKSLGKVHGVGYAINQGYKIAIQENFDIAVVMAGNNKDNPQEIHRLLDPICDSDYDFVMGSRFLGDSSWGNSMPFYRRLAIRLHPFLVGLICRKKITESTNGFRAVKTDVLRDTRIQLNHSWLNRYELEVYLLIKILMLGFKTTETLVSKTYPKAGIEITKMKPLVDWWRMLYPIFLVGLGIKK